MLFDVTDASHDGTSSQFIGTETARNHSSWGEVVAPTATMPSGFSSATLNPGSYASTTAGGYNHSAARLIRDQRRRDLLASIAEWERASGPDRLYWRRDARHRLAEWRRLYAIPERAAFQAAVANRRSAI